MITKALVIRQADSAGYLWDVNIPILNGVPDNYIEAESYKLLLNTNIKNNSALRSEQQKSTEQIAKVTSEEWGNSSLKDSRYIFTPKVRDFKGNVSEFTMQAAICGIPGMNNLIAPGDVVYVGFENNDMGKPIILGHLLTKNLEEERTNYPSSKLSTLVVKENTTLPQTTKLKLSDLVTINMDQLSELWLWYQSFKSIFSSPTALLSAINPTGGTTEIK